MALIKLCIDWGNSLIKLALFDTNDNIIERYTLNEENVLEKLKLEVLPRREFSGVIISSVTNKHTEIVPLLKELTPNIVILNSNTSLPILNAYTSKESLGADRIALAVGAHKLFADKNNLVICIGTCITYNFVGKNRTFRGGAISPGYQMRLTAMHQNTDKLPNIGTDGELILLGHDTESAMRSGAYFGIISELNGIIAMYEAQYQDFNVILTGGGSDTFAVKLKNKIFADPDLLMKGLNQILKHNVPQAL